MNFSTIVGDFDPSVPPRRVSPVAEGVRRPRWSVMIPTFNCAKYLRETLESVLSQAPGPDEMQIEVIDDCSTKDDPDAVVREVGQGRVDFFRKPQNEGAISNFNTCIDRSRGELVHILHGDDWVSPGFYARLKDLSDQQPDCSLLATRCFFVNEANVISAVSDRLLELETGGDSFESFITGTALQFAGVVVRRSFYEKYGGFRTSLVHCADWDMWVRAIARGRGIVAPEVLASYRVFEGNDSSRLIKTGENLRDMLRYQLTAAHGIAGYPLDEAISKLVGRARTQADSMRASGDDVASQAARDFGDALQATQGKPPRDLTWLLYGISNFLRHQAELMKKPSACR